MQCMDRNTAKKILDHELFMKGYFYDENTIIDFEKVVKLYTQDYAKILSKYVADTGMIVKKALQNKKHILLEGAQGLLLSIDYGTTKYQTSSDCSIEGLAKGSGLKEKDVEYRSLHKTRPVRIMPMAIPVFSQYCLLMP